MNMEHNARWVVRQSALPAAVRPCPACSGTRHRPSGAFRVNARGRLLDVWLLLRCTVCDRTSKVPVHERVHVRSLAPARLVAYETNDPAVVRELAMSASFATRNRYRLDWTATWELASDRPVLGGPTPLEVLTRSRGRTCPPAIGRQDAHCRRPRLSRFRNARNAH